MLFHAMLQRNILYLRSIILFYIAVHNLKVTEQSWLDKGLQLCLHFILHYSSKLAD